MGSANCNLFSVMVYRCAENSEKPGYIAPEWLNILRECVSIDDSVMGTPKLGPWWAGGRVEEYAGLRAIFVGDGTARIVATTERGLRVLRQALSSLGYRESFT